MFTYPTGLFSSANSGGGGDLLTDLVAAWTFESDFTDQIGVSDLTTDGSMAIAPGPVGNAALFDGASSLFCASNSALQMGAIDFTISLIVSLGAAGSEAPLLGKWGASEISPGLFVSTYADPDYLIYLASDDEVGFKIQTPGGTLFSRALLNVGVPTLIIAKHRAADSMVSTRVVELGGGLDIQNSDVRGPINAPSNGALRIGSDEMGDVLPAGSLIDAVHIWRRCLSPADEAALINGGAGIEYPFS